MITLLTTRCARHPHLLGLGVAYYGRWEGYGGRVGTGVTECREDGHGASEFPRHSTSLCLPWRLLGTRKYLHCTSTIDPAALLEYRSLHFGAGTVGTGVFTGGVQGLFVTS